MWVAQITELTDQLPLEMYKALKQRFPQYLFSILRGEKHCIICRPIDETVILPTDEGKEREILQFIITTLMEEIME